MRLNSPEMGEFFILFGLDKVRIEVIVVFEEVAGVIFD